MSESEKQTGLALLRVPFPPNQISRLPKPTKAQTDAVKADFKKGIRCKECGAWHHPDVVHLDYVGHAALTDRLLDADPNWSWEPVAMQNGMPVLDEHGGMWIRLTVCGVTRLGYGDAQEKTGANAVKERIGDALRNAAMRFGAALDLWHKGDLHEAADENGKTEIKGTITPTTGLWEALTDQQRSRLTDLAVVMKEAIAIKDYGAAWELRDNAGLDNDEKAALTTRFDSKERSAMKKWRDENPRNQERKAA